MDLLEFSLLALAAVCIAFWLWLKQSSHYWRRRGVPEAPQTFYFWKRTQHSVYDQFDLWQQHKNGPSPILGIYSTLSPVLLLLDLELIKSVIISDFDSFPDRGFYHNVRDDPLSASIVRIEGAAWKHMRAKLTPTFSSYRMKVMFPMVVTVAERFVTVLGELVEARRTEALTVRDLCARYMTDIIGSVAFGIECNSLRQPQTEFRLMGDLAFGNFRPFVESLGPKFPRLFHALHVRAFPKKSAEFYSKLVTETIEYREQNQVKRNDFLDLLIELKQKSVDGTATLNMTDIIAQAFAFLVGGFETSSSTMTFCLYELSQHADIQERARQDVLAQLLKHKNQLTYECLKDMHYLEQVFLETLRKYPVATVLRRVARKSYSVPNSSYTIQPGMNVIIPVYAIHHDESYYPNPDEFQPERFAPAEVAKRHAMTYLPFGAGPRTCIAERFGKMQTLIGVAMLLRFFKISPTPQTPQRLKFDKNCNRGLRVKGGIQLKVEKL